MYQPFGGGNMDEGWTRWVLEQYRLPVDTHCTTPTSAPAALKDKYDAIILPDQGTAQMINGSTGANIRPEYSGGIGTEGVDALKQFVGEGGTLVTLGAASAFAIENFAVPVRDLKRGLSPRSALRAGHHPQDRGRHRASGRLRHGRRDLRLLQQQPVLLAGRRLRLAEHDRRRALSERRGRGLGLAARRGADDRPGRGRLGRHEARAGSCCSGCARSTARRRTPPSRCCSTRCICRRSRGGRGKSRDPGSGTRDPAVGGRRSTSGRRRWSRRGTSRLKSGCRQARRASSQVRASATPSRDDASKPQAIAL